MIKLEIGKLYTCSEYLLLVFPTEEVSAVVTGAQAEAVAAPSSAAAAFWADWWSKELKCQVSFIPAGRVFCIVEVGGNVINGYEYHQVRVIAGEAAGWINAVDWLNIEGMTA